MRSNVMRYWYQPYLHPLMFLLLPFAALFAVGAGLRRWLYQSGLVKSHTVAAPVIIVGNITVGGTGKTPFVIWLVNFLRSQGYNPGIVSRGVGGKKHWQPHWVKADDIPANVGDEALLLLHNTQCPVVVGIDRVAAAQFLLKQSACNIIISDDGLQHYRLKRDIEIALVDGQRRMGNKYLLPAGPLRETVERLQSVDFVVVNNGNEQDQFVMTLQPTELVSVATPHKKNHFPAKQKVHAVAGIGNPQRFFMTLEKMDYVVIPHVFPDHHLFKKTDLEFNDGLPVVMTEKDAVKCKTIVKDGFWYLKVTPAVNKALEEALVAKMAKH